MDQSKVWLFIINKKIAYLPDANKIFEKDFNKFANSNFLITDCLRYRFHPVHFNLDDVLRLNIKLKPKRMILTNLHSDLDYETLLNIHYQKILNLLAMMA